MNNLASHPFWKRFLKFLLLGISFLVLLAGISQSSNGLTSASAVDCQQQGGCPPPQPQPSVCTEQPAQYPQCGGTCNGVTFPSDHTVFVTKSVNSACDISWNCVDQGVKAGECGNVVPTPTPAPTAPPAEMVTTCNGRTISRGQLEAELRLANYPGPWGDLGTELAAFNRAACPVSTPTPTPAVVTISQTCFLCDGGTFRRAGQASDCNGAPACPSLASGTNACLSSTDISGQSCAAAPTSTPTPTSAPTATPSPTPTPTPAQAMNVNRNNNTNVNEGNTQTNNQSQTTSQSQSNSNDQSVTVNTPAGGPQVILAAQPAQVVTTGSVGVGPSVVTTAPSAVTTLPKTGLPVLAWALTAFIPAGFKMKKFGGETGKLDPENPSYLSDKRSFKKL